MGLGSLVAELGSPGDKAFFNLYVFFLFSGSGILAKLPGDTDFK